MEDLRIYSIIIRAKTKITKRQNMQTMDRRSKDLQVRKTEGTVIEASILVFINLLRRDLRGGPEVIWAVRATTLIAVKKLHIIDLVTVDLRVNVQEVEVLAEVEDSKVNN